MPLPEQVVHTNDGTGAQLVQSAPRSKPGEAGNARLQKREARLKEQLAQIVIKHAALRDKTTGKNKAQAFVKSWLRALTGKELKHEAEIRGFLWDSFETVEQAEETILAAMFCGVVVVDTYSDEGKNTAVMHNGVTETSEDGQLNMLL